MRQSDTIKRNTRQNTLGGNILIKVIVQSFYGKKSVNLPLIATEGFSTVLDPAMYP